MLLSLLGSPGHGRSAPHDDVRVGPLNVCTGVRQSRRQPNERGRHDHRPGGRRESDEPDQELALSDQADFA